MHYIRWQGAIAFFLIVGVLGCLSYIFIDPIAKRVIEQQSENYTGAEVNINEVSVSFVPFGVEIKGLQATDPEKPTNNMISFNKARAQVQLWPLIFGKTIIDALVVDGLAFGEQRAAMGTVYRIPEAKTGQNESSPNSWLNSVQEDLPDPKTLLDNADLQTVKQAKVLEQSYHEEKQKLEEYKTQLPNSETLKRYEQQVKALSKIKVKTLADLEKVKKDFDQLKKAFKKERQQLSLLKEQLLASKSRLSQDIDALKNAPQQDWQKISNKYQLETIETEDFAHLIFGEKAREYYVWADLLLTHIKPLISGESKTTKATKAVNPVVGRFVHFDEESDLPSFWLKQGEISIRLAQATYHVKLSDITHQHFIISRESKVDIAADDKTQIGTLAANANFSLSANKVLTADGLWRLVDYPLEGIGLQESSALTLNLVKAMLGATGKFEVAKGQLALNNDFVLNNPQFSGQAKSTVAQVLIDTLASTDSLSLVMAATGDWLSPSWQINTPLNNLLTNALKGQIAGKLSSFKSELTSGLQAKAGDSLSLGEGELTELLNFETLLSDTDAAFENLANNDVVKQQKKKLESKAKDKLKEKLGKFFG